MLKPTTVPVRLVAALAAVALLGLGLALHASEPGNPVSGSVVINGDTVTTASRSVTLGLTAASTAGAVTAMQFSEDGTTWSGWEDYATSRAYVLTPGNGTHTVWVQFQDEAANESDPVSDSIELAEPPLVYAPLQTTGPVPVLNVAQGAAAERDLPGYVDDPAFARVLLQTVLGNITLRLLGAQAPLTVANFLQYVDADRYDNSFFHRSVPGFVIQGGGFRVPPGGDVTGVESYGPVANEFRGSNLRGTVAMAKLGGDPDSATSEWFFNLADNSANLDYQNGGFTVFGEVVAPGMDVVDALAALPIVNLGGVYSDLPAQEVQGDGSVLLEDLVYVLAATRLPDDLTYALAGAPTGIGASVTDGRLRCEAAADAPLGSGTVTVNVTAADGRTLELAVPVTVIPPDLTPPGGTLLIDGGAATTADLEVDLALDATDTGSGVADVRFSLDNSTWTDWQPYATSFTITLPAGVGTRTVYAQFRDAAGNVSESVSDTIIVPGPVTGSLLINGGAASAASRSVTLTLSATSTEGALYAMCFSRDGNSWEEWEYYATSRAFVLGPANGPQSVWVRFADEDWNESLPIRADITLAVSPFVPPVPRLKTPLGPALITYAGRAEFTLADHLEDPAYEQVLLQTVVGDVTLRLFEARAPLTVANFLQYIGSGRYTDTFFHRSVPGFVVQGGGYFITAEGSIDAVAAYGPVPNEFGPSNVRGTVAMAKVGGNPDSATCEWFFNLADNSANLDYQNGGFTVFGDIADMTVPDAIAGLATANAGDPFNALPLLAFDGTNIYLADLVYLIAATRQPDPLTFTVSGSVPGAAATITGGKLVITSTGVATVSAGTLTVRATAPDGRFLDVPVAVTVDTNRAPVLNGGLASLAVACTEDRPAKVKLKAKDPDKGDILTWSIPVPPALGTLTGEAGKYVYTPQANVVGTDAFTVRVTDSKGASDTMPVTVTISPVNDAPTVTGLDGISVPGGQSTVVNLTLADIDSPIGSVVLTVPATAGSLFPAGSIVLAGSGAARTLTLTPLATAATATAKMNVVLSDGLASAKRTVYITVTPAPPPPPAPPPAP